MTKKDYELIAAAFRNARKRVFINLHEQPIVDAHIDELCILLKQENDRFDAERFRYFCNLGRK
jgi:hypothetical protein